MAERYLISLMTDIKLIPVSQIKMHLGGVMWGLLFLLWLICTKSTVCVIYHLKVDERALAL